jgi:hypothetical protein
LQQHEIELQQFMERQITAVRKEADTKLAAITAPAWWNELILAEADRLRAFLPQPNSDRSQIVQLFELVKKVVSRTALYQKVEAVLDADTRSAMERDDQEEIRWYCVDVDAADADSDVVVSADVRHVCHHKLQVSASREKTHLVARLV